jgi:hypothetical protein
MIYAGDRVDGALSIFSFRELREPPPELERQD